MLGGDLAAGSDLGAPVPLWVWEEPGHLLSLGLAERGHRPGKVSLPRTDMVRILAAPRRESQICVCGGGGEKPATILKILCKKVMILLSPSRFMVGVSH